MPRATKYLTSLEPKTEQDFENLEEGAEWLLKYHPWDKDQVEKGNHVRDSLKAAYKAVIEHVEAGPMRTRALNLITDCRMLANQAISFPGQ